MQELWDEINDSPGELYDVIEYKEEEEEDKFNLNEYLKGDIDY